MPAPKITSVQVRRGTKVEWESATHNYLMVKLDMKQTLIDSDRSS